MDFDEFREVLDAVRNLVSTAQRGLSFTESSEPSVIWRVPAEDRHHFEKAFVHWCTLGFICVCSDGGNDMVTRLWCPPPLVCMEWAFCRSRGETHEPVVGLLGEPIQSH